jgi:hypothetical protein
MNAVARAVGFVVLLGLTGVSLSAQVRGTVVDPSGAPLKEAVVDLWTPSVRLGQRITAADGRFHFSTSEGAVRLVVRRIGAQASVRVLTPTDSAIRVVLVPAPVEVAALSVDGSRCSGREDAEAGRMWDRAATYYAPLHDTLWISSYFKTSRERVTADLAGRVQSDSNGWGFTARRGGWQSIFEWLAQATERAGHRAPDPEGFGEPGDLSGGMHQWWLTPEFRRQIRLSRLDESTIRFCPRDREKPWVEGEIFLAEDGSILRIRWRYGAPRPQPATGGEALFVAPSSGAPLPLLPSSEVTWQERLHQMVAQQMRDYREWHVTNSEPQGPKMPMPGEPGRSPVRS